MTDRHPGWYVCLDASDYPASLREGGVYRGGPAGEDMLSIVDESGEAYLYPDDRFREARLGELPGCVYVTLRAAEEYADATGLEEEEARRELTRHLLEARLTHPAVGETPALWRFRRRSAGVDLSARVVEADRLHVVTAVSVRPGYSPRRGGRATAGGRDR